MPLTGVREVTQSNSSLPVDFRSVGGGGVWHKNKSSLTPIKLGRASMGHRIQGSLLVSAGEG
jgi:hypothetical protein